MPLLSSRLPLSPLSHRLSSSPLADPDRVFESLGAFADHRVLAFYNRSRPYRKNFLRASGEPLCHWSPPRQRNLPFSRILLKGPFAFFHPQQSGFLLFPSLL